MSIHTKNIISRFPKVGTPWDVRAWLRKMTSYPIIFQVCYLAPKTGQLVQSLIDDNNDNNNNNVIDQALYFLSTMLFDTPAPI